MTESRLLYRAKTRKTHLEVYHESNICLKDMRKKQAQIPQEKPIQEIQSVSKHPNFKLRIATSFYSFRTNKNDLSGCSNLNKGCHAFVKGLTFGEESNHTLAIITPYEGIPFELEEIELYVELLAKIGFDIKFEGVYKLSDLTKKYNVLKQQVQNYEYPIGTKSTFVEQILTGSSNTKVSISEANNSEFLFFTLGQNYKDNKAAIKYVALCYLRYLFCSYTQWFPRMFLTYYKYFKKIKIKPSLDKILLFTYSSPISHLYNEDKNLIRKITMNYIHSDVGSITSDNVFRYGYYTFNGTVSTCAHKATTFSTLLAMSNDFKLVSYLEDYVKNVSKNVKGFTISHISYYTKDLGRTVFINDEGLIAEKIKDFVLKNEYHKAYLYLKQKVNKFVQLNGEFIVKPPDSSVQLLLNDYQKTKQNDDITLSQQNLKELLKD